MTQKCFYVPGRQGIIDSAIQVEAGLIGRYSGKTLECLALEYPGITVGDLDEVHEANQLALDEVYKAKQLALVSQPIRISEEDYLQAFECLPPEDFARTKWGDSFKMMEYYSGNITTIYAKRGEEHFCFNDFADTQHEKITHKIDATFTRN